MLNRRVATPRDLYEISHSAEVSAGIFKGDLQHAVLRRGRRISRTPGGRTPPPPAAGIFRVRVVPGKSPSGRHSAVFWVVREC